MVVDRRIVGPVEQVDVLQDVGVLVRSVILVLGMPHDCAHREEAEPMHDVVVSLRVIHHLGLPPAEAPQTVVDIRPERVERAADASEQRKLGVGRRLVPAEVVRHTSGADDWDVPVGRVPGDGGQAVVAYGAEEDVHLALSMVVEGGDGRGDGVTAGVGVDDTEGAIGEQLAASHPLKRVLDRRQRLIQREQARVVRRQDHGQFHLIVDTTPSHSHQRDPL